MNNEPAGTWSNDSSINLALLDSIKDGLDYKDIMDKYLAWYGGVITEVLAGLFFGYGSIPKERLNIIAKRDCIEETCITYERGL